MFKIVKDNYYFFVSTILFLIIGGIFLFHLDQGNEILFFSKNRNAAADWFFKYFTMAGEHYVYIICVFAFLFIRFRYALLFPLTGLVVTIVTYLTKSFFKHPRPFNVYTDNHLFETLNVVEGVKVVQGHSSFPSGHTMSAFALFALLAFLSPNKKSAGLLFFTIALLVGISRIYLVQHFLKDVYLGAIMGILIALMLYYAQNRWTNGWLNGAFPLPKVVKTTFQHRA